MRELTIKETALRLDCSVVYVYKILRQGKISGYKLHPSFWLIDAESVTRFDLARQKRRSHYYYAKLAARRAKQTFVPPPTPSLM